MIIDGELTEAQRKKSQQNFFYFSMINGMSYMCLGEIIVILFVLKLNVTNVAVAAISGMIYLGYLLIPIGKIVTSRVGAARCQANFWIARNIAALTVAFAAPVAIWGFHDAAVTMILIGMFTFYGCRSAGIVMSNPLIGGFSLPGERGRIIGSMNALFYIGSITSLLIIYFFLHLSDSVWLLAGIIVAGAAMGVTSSRFLAKVDEPAELREYAKKPLFRELLKIIFNRTIQKQFWASGAISMAVYLCSPMSVLAMKRAYGVNDTDALLYSAVLFGTGAVSSLSAGQIAARIGARRLALGSYMILLMVPVMWILSPPAWNPWFLCGVFALCGAGAITLNNSINQYFLATVAPKNRISAGMVLFLLSGAGAGALGLAASSSLFLTLRHFYGVTELIYYKVFFGCVLVMLLPGLWLFYRLKRV